VPGTVGIPLGQRVFVRIPSHSIWLYRMIPLVTLKDNLRFPGPESGQSRYQTHSRWSEVRGGPSDTSSLSQTKEKESRRDAVRARASQAKIVQLVMLVINDHHCGAYLSDCSLFYRLPWFHLAPEAVVVAFPKTTSRSEDFSVDSPGW
jgi:hypothetical protein